MRAARYYGKEDIRIEDVPIPEVGPQECLVEIEWCGICGTDLHEFIAGTTTPSDDLVEDPPHKTCNSF